MSLRKGSSSPILVHRLYKLLLKAATPVCNKNQTKLLSEIISVFRSEIEKFSQKDRLLQLAEGDEDALEALRYCFRHGRVADIQACIDIIPQLLRFFRASKLIHQDDLFRSLNKHISLGSLRSNYNIGAATLLSSKLFTYQRDMHGISFERLHREHLEKSTDYVRRSINRAILDRRKRSKNSLFSEELRRMRVYYMFLSLDRIFWLWDTNHVDIIDRLFPAFAKIRIPPQHRYIGDLSFYTNIVNNMPEYGLEAYGAVIDDAMYIKIVTKPFVNTVLSDAFELSHQPASLIHRLPTHPGAFPFSQLLYNNSQEPPSVTNLPTSADSRDINQSNSNINSSTSYTDDISPLSDSPRKKQTIYTHRMSAKELDGQHFFADRCYEVVFRYDPETFHLEAVMYLDPNKSVLKNVAHSSPDDGRWRVPKDHVIWQIDLSQYHIEEDTGDSTIITDNNKQEKLQYSKDERKHWLYLDREYQGIEIPVPPEFYELPANSDGLYYPSNNNDVDAEEEEELNASSSDKNDSHTSEDESGDNVNINGNSSIFGEHDLVPTICYVKFRRPPSTKRITDCLLPHTRFPPPSPSEENIHVTDEQDPPMVANTRRSWGAIRRKMQTVRSKNNSTVNTGDDAFIASNMYRAAKTSVQTFESSTTVYPSDPNEDAACTISMKTIETFYHGLPSYVEVEVRFCRRKEDYSGHSEMENGLDKVSTIMEQSLSHANDSQTMNISQRNHKPDKIIGEAVFVDENTGIAMSVMAMEASRHNHIDDEIDDDDTLEPPKNVGTDFKTLHSELTTEASSERDFRRLEPYIFETVRYGHVLDLDGAWIKVTNDGLKPVFHSELFPPESHTTDLETEQPTSSLLPTVKPITSAGAMLFISKLLGEAFHRLGMLRPGYSILGNGIYGGISNSQTSQTAMKPEWLTSNSPTDPLRQRHGHSLRGEQLTMGRRLAWEAGYWAALHNYYQYRQALAEEQYQSKLNKVTQKENATEEAEESS